ncbi:hypothetical protein EL753P1_00013 [Eggerthella phage EL753P1]|nr:hypothetical protein EL753P1_00013 [Eggerthella phage EL753P1]
MDWVGLNADVEHILTKHYTPGRNGSIKAVTIHHMAGNLSINDCYNTWQFREASAHYAVQEDGTIGQLVNDWDTAWACGNAWANSNTISIEHANNQFGPWTVNDTVLDQGAHLVAAICHKYDLGRPEWMVNVFPHSHWSATDCPGELQRSQNAEYMARAQAWYDEMGGGEAPAPVVPSPKPNAPSKQDVPPIKYRVYSERQGWLPEMHNRTDTGGSGDDYAGDGSPILYLAMDFPGWYRVCTERQGWLPEVNRYDVNDLENGCAGDGSPITKVECYYETPNPDATGWVRIRYAVANVGGGFFAEMEDTNPDQYGDTHAGNGGRISAFYAYPAQV